MFGQYKRLKNEFTGVLTGKGAEWGGSLIRPEATGYGTVYFAQNMLETRDDDFRGKTVVISGSGNVAQYAAEKVLELVAKVLTMSDSSGYVYDEDGIDTDKLAFIMRLKNVKRGRIKEYADEYSTAVFKQGAPWKEKCEVALPCATQNELNVEDAKVLVSNGVKCISEGANMPSTADAVHYFIDHKVLFAPGKASTQEA